MKFLFIAISILLSLPVFGQFKQIPSGTNTNLTHVSCIHNTIVISGTDNYIVKSTNECNSITQINSPVSYTCENEMQRLDSNLIININYTPGSFHLHKTRNLGQSWTYNYASYAETGSKFWFLDSLYGFRGVTNNTKKTTDGGATWTNFSMNPSSPFIVSIKGYKDSSVCYAAKINGYNACYFSKDKGATWAFKQIVTYTWSLNQTPIENTISDINYLNKDSLIACTNHGEFYFSPDLGNTWTINKTPLFLANGVFAKNKNEIYVLGTDLNNKGTIAKTVDLGNTWTFIMSHVTTTLNKMAIVNDSIAILVGTNGVILRWNYKLSSFGTVGLTKTNFDSELVTLFPNPVQNKLTIRSPISQTLSLTIANPLGQILYTASISSEQTEWDVSFLPPGIYVVIVSDTFGYRKKSKLIKS